MKNHNYSTRYISQNEETQQNFVHLTGKSAKVPKFLLHYYIKVRISSNPFASDFSRYYYLKWIVLRYYTFVRSFRQGSLDPLLETE